MPALLGVAPGWAKLSTRQIVGVVQLKDSPVLQPLQLSTLAATDRSAFQGAIGLHSLKNAQHAVRFEYKPMVETQRCNAFNAAISLAQRLQICACYS